jgi:hypothetical protein
MGKEELNDKTNSKKKEFFYQKPKLELEEKQNTEE